TLSEDTIVKGFIWKTDENGALTVEPMAEAFLPTGQPTFEPVQTPDATETPGETENPDSTENPDTTAYTGTFVTDEHATINVYYTQDYTTADETNVTTTSARNSDTGEITTDSTLKPQINFLVVVDDGYEVASVEVTPTENYNAIKGSSDTGVENLYRITKIVGDITITVTTTESSGLPELDEGVISAFRYSTETEISGENTEGSVSAAITASVDGTTETALELNSTDYADETLEISPRLTPVLGASTDAPWGESPYVQVALSTVNYTDIMVSAKVGATKKGPASYKLQYSTDGTTFTDVGESYTLTSNKTLYEAFSKVELRDAANECETLYIRIVPDGTTTLNDGTLTGATGGEFAVNDILIYGTSTGDGIIHLADNNITATGISNVTVDNENSTVTISAAGDYEIEGTLTDGQIIVAAADKSEEVNITLDNVSVTSSTADAQPFSVTKGQISLTPTGECSFTATGDSTAAVYSKNDMEIKCSADTDTFNATSSSGKGIHCKADLQIGNGVFVVDAGADGIQGNDSVKITAKNDSVTVTSCGDGIRSNLDPSTDTDGTYVSGGTVEIKGGEITVNAKDDADGTNDGIQADTLLTIAGGTLDITATGEALKSNASSIAYLEDSTAAETPADGDGCILISGGTITASAGEDGIKAVKNVTISGGEVTLTNALDGIQVNEIIYADEDETEVSAYVAGEIDITGGELDITSTEDGIQCKTGNINISDGTITVNATLDGIQSSYDLNISGGTFDVTTAGGAIDPTTVEDDDDAPSCKGLKAAGDLVITAGDITVNSYDDSIHSNSSVFIGDENDSNAVLIIDVTSSDDGVHADVYLKIYNGEITVENSYEGLEGAEIYINDGTMLITATDDGINGAGDDPNSDETASTSSVELMAGPDDSSSGSSSGGESSGGSSDPGSSSGGGPGEDGSQGGGDQGSDDTSDYGYIEVNGGYIYMTITSTGDGFDSNGSLYINSGVSIVNGCTSADCDGIDFGDGDDDEIDITGGYVIAIAAEGMATINTLSKTAAKLGYGTTSSNQSTGFSGNVGGNQQQGGGSTPTGSSSTVSTGDYYIVGEDGTVICAFSYTKANFGQVLISTPSMTDQTYYIRPLTTSGATASNMLYGMVDSETYAFTLDSNCTASSSTNSATMTTISGS
ncbi:MAG: carbohydrate-binding domain-containing protein, partial [Oscillospiraceae bacterium]|nr:carbohydrate-binding domain-containing protein [Oscillospiraceae bacterium]